MTTKTPDHFGSTLQGIPGTSCLRIICSEGHAHGYRKGGFAKGEPWPDCPVCAETQKITADREQP